MEVMSPPSQTKQPPVEGQIVFIHGGVAQYREGVFYSGMEDPRWTRPIQWEVKWWLPLDVGMEIKELRAELSRKAQAYDRLQAWLDDRLNNPGRWSRFTVDVAQEIRAVLEGKEDAAANS